MDAGSCRTAGMRILVLGGDGMLGHQLLQYYQDRYEVMVTLRQSRQAYAEYELFSERNSYTGIDVRSVEVLQDVFADFKPDAVINAVGIVKQRQESSDAIASITINALLPHQLVLMCRQKNARFVHMSTDCVFSGKQGMYTEHDFSDAEDMYGRTKYLGEVHEMNGITLRTSIIGLELARKRSLIEWFLAEHGKIRGFTRAIYSGLTTLEMARIIERLLTSHRSLSGLWHVASAPINKYELLCQLAERLGRNDVVIEPDQTFVCDRSLDGSAFNKAIGYEPPGWGAMLDELAAQIMSRETV
jgi:dTDP-4-dehydrorhamnose reductase